MLTNQNENIAVTYTLAGVDDPVVADSLTATTSDPALTATILDASTVNVRSADAVGSFTLTVESTFAGAAGPTATLTVDVTARAPDTMILTPGAPADN